MDPLSPPRSLSLSFPSKPNFKQMQNLPARRGGLRRFWRGSGFRSFADLPRQFARNWRECWRRSWRSAPGRRPVRLLHASGAAAQKPPPPNPRLLCIATQLGDGGWVWMSMVGNPGNRRIYRFLHFVNLFCPKLRPWLGRSSVQ